MSCLLKFLPQYHISPIIFSHCSLPSLRFSESVILYCRPYLRWLFMAHLPILRAGVSYVGFSTVSPEARAVPWAGRDLTSVYGWSEGLSSRNSSKMGSILVRLPEQSIRWRGQPITTSAPSLPYLRGSPPAKLSIPQHSRQSRLKERMCCVVLIFLFTYKFLL